MKDPEASWKGICSTFMKGREPRPRKGWEEPQQSLARGQEAERAKKTLRKGPEAKRRHRGVFEERLGRRPEGPEKAQKRPRRGQRPRPEALENAEKKLPRKG